MESVEFRAEYCWKSLSEDQIMYISEVLKCSKATNYVSYQTLRKPGDNNATEVYAVQITTTNGEVLHWITKMSNERNEKFNEITDINNIMFRNEITMYTKVLVEFRVRLQNKYVCEEFYHARCLGAFGEKTNKIMILKDLREAQYINLDQLQPLSNNTVRMVLKYLARFHTFSYTLKENSPEKFSELCNNLKDTNTFKVHSRQRSGFLALGHYFSKMFDDIKYKNVIMESFTKHADRVNSLKKYENNSKHSVIIHGDCWVKNILFRRNCYAGNNCIFIDYQMSREASPVADVLHFIFNSTDYKTRSEYYHDWLDFYYSQLQRLFMKFDLDKNIYPRTKFDAEIKKYVTVQIDTAIFRLCSLLRGTNESQLLKYSISDFGDIQELINSLKSNVVTEETAKIMKDRIEGLINSCREFGYIQVIKKNKKET